MKITISLLLFVLAASLAHAESIIPISCNEIARITILQGKTSEPPVLTDEYPYIYPTAFWFKPEAASKYKKFTDPNKVATIAPDGTQVGYRPFILSTPLGIITSDTPYQTSVNFRQIHMYFKSKKEAFEAARKICPQIKPKAFFVYDYLEEKNKRNSKNK